MGNYIRGFKYYIFCFYSCSHKYVLTGSNCPKYIKIYLRLDVPMNDLDRASWVLSLISTYIWPWDLFIIIVSEIIYRGGNKKTGCNSRYIRYIKTCIFYRRIRYWQTLLVNQRCKKIYLHTKFYQYFYHDFYSN